MWPFKDTKPLFVLSEMDDDIDSKTGLLTEGSPATDRRSFLRLHVILGLLHAALGIAWLSMLMSMVPLCRPVPDLLRPLELGEFLPKHAIIFEILIVR